MPLKNIDFSFSKNLNPMWIVEPGSHQIIDANGPALSLYGYNKTEMLSLTIDDLRTGEMEYSEDQSNGLKTEGTHKHITKGGNLIYVRITIHPIQMDGEPRQLFIADEVTEQIKKNQQLQACQQLFELIKEKLPLSLFVLNQKGHILQWNSFTEDLSGYSPKEINEMHALDFFVPDSRPKIEQALQDVWEKDKAEVEGDLLTKSGANVTVLTKAHKIQIEGEQYILGFGVDISELKEAQRKVETNLQLLQAIIDQAKSLIYIKDEEGQFQFVNEEFLSFFELTADEVIGNRDLDIMDEKDARPMQQSDQRVRKEGGAIELEESVHLDDDKPRVFLTTKMLLRDIPGFKNHVFGLSTDITQRKQMEQELKESVEQNQVLLAEIHHRVKNNLAIVSGFLDLQAMEADNVELQDNLKDSQSRILSIASTHELLYEEQDFSSISFDTNIKKLVQKIADTLSPDVTFQFSLDTVRLNIDQAIPSSLIINEMVTNAIKHAYGEGDEAIIDITLREDEGTIFLTIRDYGKGLPEDFDLYQTESLGIKLIQVLKEQLGGELKISSNGGATFELIFEKSATNDSNN